MASKHSAFPLANDSASEVPENKGGKLIFNCSSAELIFTQKLESPGFQIEQKINWKVDASSCGIQS